MSGTADALGRWAGAALLAGRVAAGTALFVVVLLAVQSPDNRIAGMMLTFPALNGISLMLAPTADKTGMARAMLATIALNGAIGLGFIAGFGWLATAIGEAALGWVWPMLAAAFAGWLVVFALLAGAPAADRWLVRGFVVAALVGAWWLWRQCPQVLPAPDGDGGLAARHGMRIGLFALTLGLLLAVGEWLGASSRLLGKLGALPLLPLFSLATIAETSGSAGAAVARLDVVKPAMLLGLLLAMAFALAYGRYLDAVRQRGWLALIGLLLGWLACGGLIVGGMRAAAWLEGC